METSRVKEARRRGRWIAVARTLLATLCALVVAGTAAGAAGAYELRVSSSADRSNSRALEGASLAGDAYVFVSPETGISQVRFWLDNPTRTGTPYMIESRAPWDFAGTDTRSPARLAFPFDTQTVPGGAHTITAEVARSAGGSEVITSTFIVSQGEFPPDQIHLAWTDDPSTTLTVVWRTRQASSPSTVRYRVLGQTTWNLAAGVPRPSGTAGSLHETKLTGLAPDTAYEYQVPGDGGVWSDVLQARTAPPAGHVSFDAIYYADTGLIGRPDGNATGTAQGIQEIARMRPLLVLPGGDYAYFDEDKRFVTLERTIDEWFNQQQPVLSQSVVMPTYGNHEVLLGESFDAWARRFPTPSGWNGRRNYSFDVGDVHFVSILAVAETTALPSASLTWIENDITAAKARGQRWIVPYMHVSSFADGNTHGSNLALRAQLGPVFERLGVDLVLTSHDQNYERTYPLVGVPNNIRATSSSRSCYTQADGVTWAKISPAGKMSDKIDNFSQWRTVPPPVWTAFRDNTVHHFGRVRVTPDALRLEVYGYVGNGTPPVLQDAFEYRVDGCPGEVSFAPSTVGFSMDEGGTVTPQTARLSIGGGEAASFNVSDNASWLSVSPTSGTTPADLQLSVNAAGLAAGSYTATVTATVAGGRQATLPVTLNVLGDFDFMLSLSSSRTNPVLLGGRTVSGNIYVFTVPETGVAQVRFYVDDPTRSGTPFMVENRGPYDLAGTNTSTRLANPFNTRTLANGSHTVTAAIDLTTGGTEVVTSGFTVQNP
jgi:Purple acid Phosphatase, N-terminal domain/Calcineurin-like phosphoesterase/Viral BACON domain